MGQSVLGVAISSFLVDVEVSVFCTAVGKLIGVVCCHLRRGRSVILALACCPGIYECVPGLTYSRHTYAHACIFHLCPHGQALTVLMLLHSHLSSPPYTNIYSANTIRLHTSTRCCSLNHQQTLSEFPSSDSY